MSPRQRTKANGNWAWKGPTGSLVGLRPSESCRVPCKSCRMLWGVAPVRFQAPKLAKNSDEVCSGVSRVGKCQVTGLSPRQRSKANGNWARKTQGGHKRGYGRASRAESHQRLLNALGRCPRVVFHGCCISTPSCVITRAQVSRVWSCRRCPRW